jgi:hypothetical protein
MLLFWSLNCPLSGAIDIGISHSLYNQVAKKAVLYEKQHLGDWLIFLFPPLLIVALRN